MARLALPALCGGKAPGALHGVMVKEIWLRKVFKDRKTYASGRKQVRVKRGEDSERDES